MCGNSEQVRNDINLGVPICDFCRKASGNLESDAQKSVVQQP